MFLSKLCNNTVISVKRTHSKLAPIGAMGQQETAKNNTTNTDSPSCSCSLLTLQTHRNIESLCPFLHSLMENKAVDKYEYKTNYLRAPDLHRHHQYPCNLPPFINWRTTFFCISFKILKMKFH